MFIFYIRKNGACGFKSNNIFQNFMIFWLEKIMLMAFQVKHFLKLQNQQ